MTEKAEQAKKAALEHEKHWYIVQTYVGRELAVVEALRSRIKTLGLEALFGEIMVPTEEVVEMRSGKKHRSQRKFYPGYVFVHMVMNEDSWYLVRNLPWVAGFVGGNSERPAPVSNREIERILGRMEDGGIKPHPKTSFAPGEVVRIVDGPFSEFDGVVDSVNYEKNRLTVSVSIFGRSTPVELEFNQVRKS